MIEILKKSNTDSYLKSESNPVARSIIPVVTGFWTGGSNLNGGGTPGYMSIYNPGYYLLGDTTSINWEARVVNVGGNGQPYPGDLGTIDWDKPWTATMRIGIRCPAVTGNYISILFGGASSTPTTATLASKGLKFTVRGNSSSSTVECLCSAYNSTEASGTAVTWTAGTNSITFVNLLFRWEPGVGFFVYANGSRTALCSVTSQLPSGSGTTYHCNTIFYGKSLSGSGTAVTACWGVIDIFPLVNRY